MSVMLYPWILCVALLINLFVWCVFDSVCELFGETIRNVFGCGCYFVVECYGILILPLIHLTANRVGDVYSHKAKNQSNTDATPFIFGSYCVFR